MKNNILILFYFQRFLKLFHAMMAIYKNSKKNVLYNDENYHAKHCKLTKPFRL